MKITVFADNVPKARSMTMSPDGTLFVGTREDSKVYALRDNDNDGYAEEKFIIADSLKSPNGVALNDGDLYVAEISRILKYEDIEKNLDNPPAPIVVNDTFPKDEHHGWKFIKFGPDGKLYVPVGAPCNNCLSTDKRYASIMRMNRDGSELQIFAEGVRNTVGFDWNPETDELWFTDNGRDRLGDDIPGDELNNAPEIGLHFGYPFCHAGTISDPTYGSQRSCQEFRAPKVELGPHVAALGMRFYTGEMFPAQYKNQIFIAEHGSWNRSEKIGYQVSLVTINDKMDPVYEPFATGWLQGQQAWGRPVDVEIANDGSLLVSDDLAGVIYKIFYTNSQR